MADKSFAVLYEKILLRSIQNNTHPTVLHRALLYEYITITCTRTHAVY